MSILTLFAFFVPTQYNAHSLQEEYWENTVSKTGAPISATITLGEDDGFIGFWFAEPDGWSNRIEIRITSELIDIVKVNNDIRKNISRVGIGTSSQDPNTWSVGVKKGILTISRSEPGVNNRVIWQQYVGGHPDKSGILCWECNSTIHSTSVLETNSTAKTKTKIELGKRSAMGLYTAGIVGGQRKDLASDDTLLAKREKELGYNFGVASWFARMGDPSIGKTAMRLASQGKTSLIALDTGTYSFEQIMGGAIDEWLSSVKNNFSRASKPVVVRLMPEMNGDWSPVSKYCLSEYCAGVVSHEDYKTLWKYIHDRVDTKNVKWMFSVNSTDEPRIDRFEYYYPGSSYVDYFGIDSYNWGDSSNGHKWREPQHIVGESYWRLAALGKQDIWLSETGSKEPLEDDGTQGFSPIRGLSPINKSQDKGKWISKLLSTKSFPRCTKIVWFDIDKERNWRIDSSENSIKAWNQWNSKK